MLPWKWACAGELGVAETKSRLLVEKPSWSLSDMILQFSRAAGSLKLTRSKG